MNIYVIAGPNGAGKTTFAEGFLPAECQTFINADTIARGLSAFSPDAAALKAGRLLLEQIDACVNRKINFAFETTLSGTAYASRFKEYKNKGYKIHLFFLWIPNIKLSLARVASRVKMGGHNISEKVLRRRFYKGIKNFFYIYQSNLDFWMLFDNSGQKPHLIAKKDKEQTSILDGEAYKKIMKLAEEK
ncbi:MAG: zeta toxin family protein [Candidatus Omnitrophica bacterium]|nr:zeta toxin family protein [Candidatus Omnitrophota bacterium]